MGEFESRLQSFRNNRWLVFVAAMWIQSVGGIGYLYGSISPIIKTSLNYNQKQIASLGVAKDLGDSLGFFAGALCEILPLWGLILVGAIQNFLGYGFVWLVVTARLPLFPLWAMWLLIFVGTNGETYFNTAALVSCVQNFPRSRGPIVGILKGFAGLSGAILTQVYALIHTPDSAALIFMVAVGPTMVVIAFMFFIRPVEGHLQMRSSDDSSFTFIYSLCLLLAAYLMGVMLLQDLVELNYDVVIIFTVILFVLLLLPIAIPLLSSCFLDLTMAVGTPTGEEGQREQLLPKTDGGRGMNSDYQAPSIVLSDVEDERSRGVDLLQLTTEQSMQRQKRIAQLQAKLFQTYSVGAVRVRRRMKRGPRRGEDFTLRQALIKADFWLLFFSLMLGSGSGLTVIDNLGQMSESAGYDQPHIFVSLVSIFNFLGRVGGGYFSELVIRKKAFPRPAALSVAQLLMAIGHFLFAMAWPGTMYVSTLLVGLGYGAHWAIVPASASELFGLRNFGALYNFLTIANPAGSLLFSGVVASYIYDSEAEKQAGVGFRPSSVLGLFLTSDEPLVCMGRSCFFLTSLMLSGLCVIAAILTIILVYRTRTVYTHLYGNSSA